MVFYLWPKGWAKPLVVNWQIMAACSYKINPSTSLPLCIMQFLDNYNYFGYLKGANEVNRQYFQQAVLLCLLGALYYAPMLHVSYYAKITLAEFAKAYSDLLIHINTASQWSMALIEYMTPTMWNACIAMQLPQGYYVAGNNKYDRVAWIYS